MVKARAGKLDADIVEVSTAVERDDFVLLDITPAHLAALARLPAHTDHRDPFDHLLIAQAIAEEATFVSQDRNVPRYPVARMACSSPAD